MKYFKTYEAVINNKIVVKSKKKKSEPKYSDYEKMVREYLFEWAEKPEYTINEDKSVDVHEIPYDTIDISIEDNDIKSKKLPFKFGNVVGNFTIRDGFLTLEGCPNFLDGDFNCSNNDISSLIGCPKNINGYLDCSNNNHLMSLEGFPSNIGTYISIVRTPIYIDVIVPIINIKEDDLDEMEDVEEHLYDKYVKYAIRCIIDYDVVRKKGDKYSISKYRLDEAKIDFAEHFKINSEETKQSKYLFED